MESFDEISFRSTTNMSFISNIEDIKEENIIFFIFCFHNFISDDKSFSFYSQKNNVKNISQEYFEKSEQNENYKYRVYCIHFNGIKKEKYAHLQLKYKTLKNIELTKFFIKNQKYFAFAASFENILEKSFLSLI